jgi:hypothetical protein
MLRQVLLQHAIIGATDGAWNKVSPEVILNKREMIRCADVCTAYQGGVQDTTTNMFQTQGRLLARVPVVQ